MGGFARRNHRGEPLEILDRCRIRWGRVESVHGDHAVVTSQPLTWDEKRLELGAPRPETVTVTASGLGFTELLKAGDWVSMHWNWVCDKLNARQLTDLKRFSARQVAMTNDGLTHPGPAIVMG